MEDGLVNYLHTVVVDDEKVINSYVIDYFNSSEVKIINTSNDDKSVKIRPLSEMKSEFSFLLVDRKTARVCLIQREALPRRYVFSCFERDGRLVLRRLVSELFVNFDNFFVHNERIHFIRNEMLSFLY
jgi:hypothetical protein